MHKTSPLFDQWRKSIPRERLESFGQTILVTVQPLELSGMYLTTWFLNSTAESELNEIQKFHIRNPGADAVPARFSFHPDHQLKPFCNKTASKSFSELVDYLARCSNLHDVWVLLIQATLHQLFLSHKSRVRFKAQGRKLLHYFQSITNDSLSFHHQAKELLPQIDGYLDDSVAELEPDDLYSHICSYHSALFQRYSFYRVELTNVATDRYDLMVSEVEKENAAAQDLIKAMEEADREREELTVAKEKAINKRYPLRKEWSSITQKRLEELVWTMPMVELSEQIGVSDSMISKRCRQLKVVKPGRGFWAKVDAAKVPHPNGKRI